LLDNRTDTPFITGDQPIINMHATYEPGAPEKLEFFYPISPQKAMLLLESSDHSQSVTAENVLRYNNLIARISHEQVFSNSREYLATSACRQSARQPPCGTWSEAREG